MCVPFFTYPSASFPGSLAARLGPGMTETSVRVTTLASPDVADLFDLLEQPCGVGCAAW